MNKHFLDLANSSEPALMQKTAMAIKLTEKLASEFVPDILKDFETISEVTLEKVAASPVSATSAIMASPTGKGAIGVAAAIGAGIAASLGTAIASDLYDAARKGLTSARNYKRIMDFDPSLKEVPASGNKTLKNTFTMIHRYAPDFTSDPVLGSSLLRSMISVPVGNEFQALEKLIGSRGNLINARKNQFQLDPKELRGAWRKGKGQDSETTPESLKNPGATSTNESSGVYMDIKRKT